MDLLVVPAPEMRAIVVRGSDGPSWLNGLVTCDVSKLEPKRALYGLMVTKKGRIQTDLVLVQRDGAILVVVPEVARAPLLETFDHHLVMEDVELATSAPFVWFAHGARAKELAVEGAIVAELDRTGLGGAIVIADEDVGGAVADAARALGGALGDDRAWEALRVERGVPRFGRDFDEQTYPQEASLEKVAVSFDKGCYLGQEVVCMLELRGHVKRKLVRVALSAPVAAGTPITDDNGAEVGRVTSSVDRAGLAMLKLALTAPGTEVRAGDVTARVS